MLSDDYEDRYQKMVGFVPPRVARRLERLGRDNPELLAAQEHARELSLQPRHTDEKTIQLVAFAVLMAGLREAAVVHGLAALRAGATMAQLQEVINVVTVFKGVSVANQGAVILDQIEERWTATERPNE